MSKYFCIVCLSLIMFLASRFAYIQKSLGLSKQSLRKSFFRNHAAFQTTSSIPIQTSQTTSSIPFITTQTTSSVPLKVMVFIDGTWLYYSLVQGRGENCPIYRKYGADWAMNYEVDWKVLPQIIAANIQKQLSSQLGYARPVEICRSSVFTSLKESKDSLRNKMVSDWKVNNYEVHCYTTTGKTEKCVDIALAVEMLYMATVPEAYDIAVIVTGDKDFIPAMQKTRMKAKRVGICSMRNGCNTDLTKPELHLRDFDVIWLDDYIENLIIPKFAKGSKLFIE